MQSTRTVVAILLCLVIALPLAARETPPHADWLESIVRTIHAAVARLLPAVATGTGNDSPPARVEDASAENDDESGSLDDESNPSMPVASIMFGPDPDG